jgi:hypothetical protein
MELVALVVSLLAAAAIVVLGIRFFTVPAQATRDYGVAPDDVSALTAIKGGRDITLGAIVFVVWATVGREAVGWVMIAAAIAPIIDATIVTTHGGKLSHALSVHGLTAAVMIAAGLVLALS